MKKRFWLRRIAMFVLMGITAILLFTFLVMTLWNAILPTVLHVSSITFGQALGILLLSKILFGGFRGGWGGRRRQHWRQHMENKWSSMSAEEKEKFQQNWRSRCSQWRKPENSTTPATDQ